LPVNVIRVSSSRVATQLTFIIEAIDSVYTCTLVVAPENEKVFRVLDLVGKEETDSLERLLPPIDVVAEEKIVCFWREPAILEKSE
jgi:hypothetical protein